MLFTIAFLKGMTERAIKAFAQTLAGLIAAQTTGLMGVGNLDWPTLVSVSLLVTIMSILTSVANPEFVAGKDAVAAAEAKADIAAAQSAAGGAVSPAVGSAENVLVQVQPDQPEAVETVSEPEGDSTLPMGFFDSRASRSGDLK